MRNKIVLSCMAATAAIAMLGGPANASSKLASPVLLSISTGGSQDGGVHNVVPQCTAGPGVSKNLGSITYVVQGSADAASTNGSVGIGTALTCYIKDADTGQTYGAVTGGLPGPHAQAAGTIDVPLNSNPYLCATAHAVFNDEGTASENTC